MVVKYTTSQLSEMITSTDNEVKHLRKENKELKDDIKSLKVINSRLKVYIDELIATSNENIAMLDKKLESFMSNPIKEEKIPEGPKQSRAVIVYQEYKRRQNENKK